MNQISRNSLILLAFITFTLLFLTAFVGASQSYMKEVLEEIKISGSPPLSSSVHLSFVGDIMLDRGVKGKVNRYGKGDYHFIFENAAFLKEPDLMFANLEGPVSARGANVGSIYSFRFDPIVLSVLKDVGFDVLSMANNHIGDWGRLALEDTITLGQENGFDMVGGGMGYQDAKKPSVYEVSGIKVAYLGFSDFTTGLVSASDSDSLRAGVLSASDPNIATIISDAAAQSDILIVSYHFGDEYQSLSNNRQKHLAHLAIDSGADIVAGHHPHVEEEVEEYNGGVIAYSLGNFVFDQNFSKQTMQGMKLDVIVSKKGIESFSTSTIFMNSNYQPSVVQ